MHCKFNVLLLVVCCHMASFAFPYLRRDLHPPALSLLKSQSCQFCQTCHPSRFLRVVPVYTILNVGMSVDCRDGRIRGHVVGLLFGLSFIRLHSFARHCVIYRFFSWMFYFCGGEYLMQFEQKADTQRFKGWQLRLQR